MKEAQTLTGSAIGKNRHPAALGASRRWQPERSAAGGQQDRIEGGWHRNRQESRRAR
jgi:hypothetical protein